VALGRPWGKERGGGILCRHAHHLFMYIHRVDRMYRLTGSVSLSFCTITKNIEANVTKFGTRGDLEVPSNVADFLFEKSKVKGAPVQCEKVVGMGLWVCAISVIKLA